MKFLQMLKAAALAMVLSAAAAPSEKDMAAYLMVYFSDSDHSPHMALSSDGAFYLAMTDLHIFARREGLRDTEWQRDGAKYGWGNNRGFVLMKSTDLIRWARANLRVDKAFADFEEIGCAWAPETIYDPKKKKMMLYFTTRFGGGVHRIYYPHNFAFSETTDFKTFTHLGYFNQGVMKSTNFTSPKHGAVIHLTKQEAESLARHWKLASY